MVKSIVAQIVKSGFALFLPKKNVYRVHSTARRKRALSSLFGATLALVSTTLLLASREASAEDSRLAVTTVPAKAGDGSQIDFIGNVGFDNRTSTGVRLLAGQICNHRNGGKSGTLYLGLRYTPGSDPSGSGYTAAEANLGQLDGGYCFNNVAVTSSFQNPPNGDYFVNVVVTEYEPSAAGQRVLHDQAFISNESVGVSPPPVTPPPSNPPPSNPPPSNPPPTGSVELRSGATAQFSLQAGQRRSFYFDKPAGEGRLNIVLDRYSSEGSMIVQAPGYTCVRETIQRNVCTADGASAERYEIRLEGSFVTYADNRPVLPFAGAVTATYSLDPPTAPSIPGGTILITVEGSVLAEGTAGQRRFFAVNGPPYISLAGNRTNTADYNLSITSPIGEICYADRSAGVGQESCSFLGYNSAIVPGLYLVTVSAKSDYSVSVLARGSVEGVSSDVIAPVRNGESVNVGIVIGTVRNFGLTVPAGATSLKLEMSTSSGEVLMTASNAGGTVCPGNGTSCEIANPPPGNYKITLSGMSNYLGTFKAKYDFPPPPPPAEPPPVTPPPSNGGNGGNTSGDKGGGGALGWFALLSLLSFAALRGIWIKLDASRRSDGPLH